LRKFTAKFAQTSDGIIGAEKPKQKMNLQPQAEIEPARRTRSKLEAHREAIFALRRKHWTYGQISAWLNERGVSTTLTSVYRFCERAIARRPRNSSPLEVEQAAPNFTPTPQPTTTKTTNQYRFNLDI
jgi:DNA invertase Pin-like site-specific DNA recombinase